MIKITGKNEISNEGQNEGFGVGIVKIAPLFFPLLGFGA